MKEYIKTQRVNCIEHWRDRMVHFVIALEERQECRTCTCTRTCTLKAQEIQSNGLLVDRFESL